MDIRRKKNLLTRALDGFNRGFEKLTGRYVGLLKLIVNRRVVTFAISGGLLRGHLLREQNSAGRFYSQRRPGYDLRHHPDTPGLYPGKNQRGFPAASENLRRRSRASNRVSSLAGYEIMTEGRGSNAGTCLINLKPWSEREREREGDHGRAGGEIERTSGRSSNSSNHPAIPGFGTSGGFSMRLLDKNNGYGLPGVR